MRSHLLDAALLLAGGALYGAAFPPYDCTLSAWITLVPLLAVASRGGPWRAFAAGAAYGAIFFTITVAWVVEAVAAYFHTGIVGALAISTAICAVFVSGYVGLFAVGARRLLRHADWSAALTVPALWVGFEVARATLLTGLPWELLGHAQWRHRTLIQIADFGGVYAVSYVVVAVNVGCYLVLRALARAENRGDLVRATAPLTAALLLVGTTVAYGGWRLRHEHRRQGDAGAVVTVVQGNPRQAWTWSRAAAEHALVAYSRLSREALAAVRPDLLVWPEYAITLYPATDPVLMPALTAIARETTGGLVFGAPRVAADATGATYRNSTYHLGPDGGWTSYDKIRLVPFAEYRPFAVGEAVAGEDERIFTPGTRASVFASPLGRLGPLICYEAIFPERARALAHAGAEVLLNLSNDGWLDRAGLGAGAQHLSIVVFRAVETRRYLVRAAASGISGFVDPTGRPFALLGAGERGFTSGRVQRRRDLTFYVRYGDVFAATCAVLALAALVHTRREVAA